MLSTARLPLLALLAAAFAAAALAPAAAHAADDRPPVCLTRFAPSHGSDRRRATARR